MRDDRAADKNNEPWTKLEKRYKEYRNPVLILTPGLQTRLCCRFVENHVSKEWHCWAAAAPKASLTPLSTVSAQRCRAALVAAHLGLTEAPPRSLPSSSSTGGARWRGHGQRGAAAQRAGRGPTARNDVACLCLLLPCGHHQPHGHRKVVGQARQLGDKTEFFHLLLGRSIPIRSRGYPAKEGPGGQEWGCRGWGLELARIFLETEGWEHHMGLRVSGTDQSCFQRTAPC